MRHQVSTSSDNVSDQGARVFRAVVIRLLVVWAILATALLSLVYVFRAEYGIVSTAISVVSGLIAVGSMIPGLTQELVPQSSVKSAQDTNAVPSYIGPLFGGMLLRLVATVALFVLCRYQMAESAYWIAALTIGWYVVLTIVEVTLLAKALPRSDRLSMTDGTASSLTVSVVEVQ